MHDKGTIGIKLSLYHHALKSKLRLFLRHPSFLLFYAVYYSKLMVAPRPDIDVVSYPKSGRTWLEQLLIEAILAKHAPNVDAHGTLVQLRDHIAGLPRVNFTHAGSSWESRALTAEGLRRHGARDARAPKLIYLYRDPRDVLVSAYYHARFRTGMTSLDKAALIENPYLGIDKIVAFLNLWRDRVAARPDSAIAVSYEDLHRDTEAVLLRIVRFIGLDVERTHIRCAVVACRFDRMQAKERSGAYANPWLTPVDQARTETFKVRRGAIGEHRSFFSPEEIERIDQRLRDALSPRYGYVAQAETRRIDQPARANAAKRKRQ